MLNGEITEEELEAAKSYALGRYQMGAQTVAQISNFYRGRYFGDGHVKDYGHVPDAIRSVTTRRMIDVAREFVQADIWVLAGVGCGKRQELVRLQQKLDDLFK